MDSGQSQNKVVLIGLETTARSVADKYVEPEGAIFIQNMSDFEYFLENFKLDSTSIVIVGSELTGIGHLEIAQTVRNYFTDVHLVFVTSRRELFSISELKKNGFSKSMLLPGDRTFLEQVIQDASRSSVTRLYKAIKMVDIEPDSTLEFSVYAYMPINGKYALLTSDGKLSAKKFEKLKESIQTTLYVRVDQAEKFYEHAAERLMKLSQGGQLAISETEREEKLRTEIQFLFHQVLNNTPDVDFNTGRDLLEQGVRMVQKFIEQKTQIDIRKQMREILEKDSDAYKHAEIISTLACLLSIGTGVGNPQDLAIAGLFHDVGATDGDQQDVQHPYKSVHLLKEKKMTLTPSIAEIIEKHHERVDGTGYPNQLPEHKIPLEAQLLSFIDHFEYMARNNLALDLSNNNKLIKDICHKAGLSLELQHKISNFFQTFQAAEKSAS